MLDMVLLGCRDKMARVLLHDASLQLLDTFDAMLTCIMELCKQVWGCQHVKAGLVSWTSDCDTSTRPVLVCQKDGMRECSTAADLQEPADCCCYSTPYKVNMPWLVKLCKEALFYAAACIMYGCVLILPLLAHQG